MCGREGGRRKNLHESAGAAAFAAAHLLRLRFPLAEPGARLSDAPSRVATENRPVLPGSAQPPFRVPARTAGIIRRLQEETSLIGALIVTHGNLANELLFAARKIESTVGVIEAVPLDWADTVDEAREKIRLALERVGAGGGVIIFTDMFGGTPSNISLSFLEKDRVEIITGVNLPMIVKFAMLHQDGKDLTALAHAISERGSKSIRVASDLLSAEKRAGVPS